MTFIILIFFTLYHERKKRNSLKDFYILIIQLRHLNFKQHISLMINIVKCNFVIFILVKHICFIFTRKTNKKILNIKNLCSFYFNQSTKKHHVC